MYLQNKYTNWYFNIINAAKSRSILLETYTEKHHIIPKSLGGDNSKENLVKLTAREHYICHLLMTKMLEGENRRKMWYASYMMMRGIKRFKPSARMYELVKQNMIKANKERPGPNLGKKLTDEQKEKLSIARKGKPLGPMSEDHKLKLKKPKSEEHKRKLSEAKKGKTYGYTHSEETKKKISKSHENRIYTPISIEQKQKQSAALKGKQQTPEHIEKRSKARIGIPRTEETKQKIREARAKQIISAETKIKMSEAQKQRHYLNKLNTK